MPTLNWMGKDKVITYHRQVPYRVLEKVPDKGVLDPHGSDCGNMVIHGDNLEALKALLPEYEGRISCIYIDPPYNTGEEHWIYNDNVNDPRIRKWIGLAVGVEGQDFARHDKWLCMMYPRLRILRDLLSEDGFIAVSINDVE
jgi:adenine-specific DNA-methyltransferase